VNDEQWKRLIATQLQALDAAWLEQRAREWRAVVADLMLQPFVEVLLTSFRRKPHDEEQP
jgi:hypothetical protein